MYSVIIMYQCMLYWICLHIGIPNGYGINKVKFVNDTFRVLERGREKKVSD